jgi:hypothetical protein
MDVRAYMFRPGWVQPVHGEGSRTGWYRALYAAAAPLYPLLRRVAGGRVTTTEAVGRAMLAVVGAAGTGPRVLRSKDINRLAAV